MSTWPPSPDPSPKPSPDREVELLLTYLSECDAVCPLCRYNLRGLTVPRCPECGRDIKLAVGLVEQNLRPFILLVAATILPAGMGVLAWGIFFREGFRIYDRGTRAEILSLIGFQLSVFVALLPVVYRRRFLKLPTETQWKVALASVAEPVLLYGMLFSSMFSH